MSNSSAQDRLITVTEKTTSKQKVDDESTELGKLKLEYTLLKATKTRVRNKLLKLRKLNLRINKLMKKSSTNTNISNEGNTPLTNRFKIAKPVKINMSEERLHNADCTLYNMMRESKPPVLLIHEEFVPTTGQGWKFLIKLIEHCGVEPTQTFLGRVQNWENESKRIMIIKSQTEGKKRKRKLYTLRKQQNLNSKQTTHKILDIHGNVVKKTRKPTTCSLCKSIGHNKQTCPFKNANATTTTTANTTTTTTTT